MTDTTPAPRFWALIAHRGAPTRYPENSLAGYKAVLNMAMLQPDVKMFFEADVRTTLDGTAIAHHDKTLKRTLGLPGVPEDYGFSELSRIALAVDHARNDGPLDFAALKAERGSDAPLFTITPPGKDGPGDYRVPTLRELLELTRDANLYRAQHGTPVGICFDLKSTSTFPALAETINGFVRDHPECDLPKITLGLAHYVKPFEMNNLHQMLEPAAQQNFYRETSVPTVRRARLVSVVDNGFRTLFGTASMAETANRICQWSIAGDVDPSPEVMSPLGSPGQDMLRGNFPAVATRPAALAAMRRQDLIWADNAWEAMGVISAVQREQSLLNATNAQLVNMGRAEAGARQK